ncbi:hypothetical protein SCHPADRAFT_189908 [Schizopora paradoxa]|uniref:Uncharacterized protein n=1 Tax=Schizopora paradoxa TaxID=27342 RepID=A0A0H2RXW3_9AGAM|nr:hypothetical protein SCHPADRAFT_189908 [Schizopora paradoxa]
MESDLLDFLTSAISHLKKSERESKLSSSLTRTCFQECWPAEFSASECVKFLGQRGNNGQDEMMPLRTALRYLQQGTTALRVMVDMLDRSTKSVMSALQQTNLKRQVTINRLSSDILSMIFYFVHENVADDDPENDHPIPLLLFRSALTLSHVCRQFRSVALGLPKLWSTISNLQDPKSIKHSVLRSRDSPLHVTMKLTVNSLMLPHGEKPSGKPGKKDAACIKKIREQSSRWKSFDLALHIPHDAEDDLEHILPGFLNSFKNLKLDTLKKLTVKIDGWFSAGAPDNNTKVIKMFSSWHIPSLYHCVLVDFLPYVPISKSISILDITITDGSYTEESLLVDDLMKFVDQHPNISELYLSIWDDAFDVQETGTVKLTSPLLRKVRIRGVVGDDPESILCILRALSLIDLEDVTLEFDLLHLFELQRTISSQELHVATFQEQLIECIDELQLHASLKSFTLRIGQKALPDAFSKCNVLDAVFRKLSNLQHLSISAPDFPQPRITSDYDIALQSLKLDKCHKFSNTFFMEFFETLKRKGALDEFERLEVEGCEELERSAALKYLPQNKVAWDSSRQVLAQSWNLKGF